MSEPTFTPEQVADARADWVGRGLDAGRFDAAMAPAPEPSSAPQEPPASEALTDLKTPALSPQEVAQARVEWLKHGLDPAAFDAAVAEDGLQPVPEDTRSDDQKEFDAYWGDAPQPHEYRVDYVGRSPRDMTADQLAAVDAAARGFLSDLQVPVAIGNDLVERMIDAGHRLQAMSGPERVLWQHEQRLFLERVARSPERAQELRTLALAALERSPIFARQMAVYEVFSSAEVVAALGLNEERRRTRG